MIPPDDAAIGAPDARVVGDEPEVVVDFQGMIDYGKSQSLERYRLFDSTRGVAIIRASRAVESCRSWRSVRLGVVDHSLKVDNDGRFIAHHPRIVARWQQ